MKKKNAADDVYLETVRKRRKSRPQNMGSRGKRFQQSLDPDSPRSRFSDFMHQEIGTDGWGFIPPQYTGVTLMAALLFVPKLLGMGFFFFYLSKGDAELYAQVHTGDPLLDWVIGYEIFAVIALIFILKNVVSEVLE